MIGVGGGRLAAGGSVRGTPRGVLLEMDLLGARWGGRSHPSGSGVRLCVMLGYPADVGPVQTYILRRNRILHRETVLSGLHRAFSATLLFATHIASI